MNLPPIDNRPGDWSPAVIEGWVRLVEKANRMKAKVGGSDAFERMLARFRDMASSGRFDGLKELLGRRLGARALTWLWLHDEVIGSRLFNERMLDALIEHQQPRLSRLTMIQLIQLYFRHFDRLDERDKQVESSLRGRLELHLLDQLQRLPARRQALGTDPLATLNREGEWLLTLDGPLILAKTVREQGSELAKTFEAFGLSGFDVGRYGDICRAHFYLEVLRQLQPGEWDEVLDELLKPSVSKAPYEGDKRIGHVALEIMIDRAGDEPGNVWQDFILSLAGDPRIASSAQNFREWWKPLGEERISKVRGWLSKEDLRLFLQAVEQYGIESRNDDLQRMFPARKRFLEGLFKLKLIRNTRLLLGARAKHSVKRILGTEVKTSFASMDGQMSDKAVIYLDCGDFHLVEGSHSFKIWVYLAAPGESLRTYERNNFSHFDLINTIPATYEKLYPGLPYDAFVHTPYTWQNKVFAFLADNGIEVDVEQLLSREDYQLQLRRFGIPVVKAKRTVVPSPVSPRAVQTAFSSSTVARGDRDSRAPRSVPAEPVSERAESVDSPVGDKVLAASTATPATINQSPRNEASTVSDGIKRIASLKPSALKVLRYFADNPGDKVRYAANVLEVEAREINQILYGPLKGMCVQDSNFGWHLTKTAQKDLEVYDQQQ
ncbi:EH signature domain-containing protein [Pseudomonas aeruginosa]|uniref:EH signature domain-containing protein n=1 Tax=Pseudomonas aeruginosa TaxID=287 RepID=UPI0029938721|nr:EH signature domain-containing protein [Pseudomonas aeruginosa]MDW5714100.1 EH signature domain-containing protein [Pseudomonas aeruginosa]HBP6668268.1 hypothetical protein [Pseudomonas aeruginosa]